MSSGPGEIIGVGRAQEAEAVLQHLDDALADDLDLVGGQLLEDREHQLLLAHGAGVLDLQFFGEGEHLRRGLGLEVLKLDFPHGECPEICRGLNKRTRDKVGEKERETDRVGACRDSLAAAHGLRTEAPQPRIETGPSDLKEQHAAETVIRDQRQARREAQNGFTTTRMTMTIISTVGASLIDPVEPRRPIVPVSRESFTYRRRTVQP